MSNTIKVKRGSSAALPILSAGEFGFTTDTKQIYIGDGTVNHELAQIVDVINRLVTQDTISPYVVSGLTATVTGTDVNVTIAAGTAYNTQRLHTTTDTVLTVTNTGVAHTEYVSANTSGALIITTTARAADELPVADVSVDAAGVATAVTDVRQLKLYLKTAGVERLTVDKDGNVGIGTTSPENLLTLAYTGTGHHLDVASLQLIGDMAYVAVEGNLHSNTFWHGTYFASIRFRGTKASPLAVAENDIVFALYSAAYDGNPALPRGIELAKVTMEVDGPVSTGVMSGRIVFYTRRTTGTNTARMTIKNDGNVGIGTTAPTNILQVVQGSATDPIADAWTVYSSLRGKNVINQTTDFSPVLKELKTVPIHLWTRKLVRPKLTDYKGELDEKGKVIRTAKKQFDEAIKECNKKKVSHKFTKKTFSIIAEEAPESVVSKDEKGIPEGIDLLGYIGWLHSCVKGLAEYCERLENRIAKLEAKEDNVNNIISNKV